MPPQQPLQQPVVSCPLGRLYNKEAVIAYLLNPPTSAESQTPFGSDGQLVAGHIRSLKDVVTLSLTPNPNLDSNDSHDGNGGNGGGGGGDQTLIGAANERDPPAPFVCPISLREMNGAVKFVYRKPCGCVVADSALREMRKSLERKNAAAARSTQAGAAAPPTAEDVDDDDETLVCPVDGARNKAGVVEEWVTINPKEDELDLMRERFEARKRQEKEDRKAAKKRKNGAGGAVADGDAAGDEPKAKKAKAADAAAAHQKVGSAPAIKAGATVSGLSATLAAKLAEQKKQQSPAIASLYTKKTDNEMKVRCDFESLLAIRRT